jgi:hypothetical protein
MVRKTRVVQFEIRTQSMALYLFAQTHAIYPFPTAYS